MKKIQQLIDTLVLKPLDEGGYFKRLYTAPVKPGENRALADSIYYLLESGDFSCFHRIDADELWHYYEGSPLAMYEIKKNGELVTHKLGPVSQGYHSLIVIPRGSWYAAEVIENDSYTLLGCTAVPEFTEEGFEMADESLLTKFPQHASLIKQFLR